MHRIRLVILNILVLSAAAVLIARLFQLQIVGHESVRALPARQHELYQTLVPARGQIFAKENREGGIVPVVTNIEKSLVFAEPPRVTDPQAAAAALAKILGLPKAEVLQRLTDTS